MSSLKIYKASAGSGKTHKLTGEYIDLLFGNPYNYKNILAVTFTNKASTEMKSRIIEELFKISEGKSGSYSDILKEKYKLNDNQIKLRALKCLKMILHDFTKFSIETIDSFFQKIILSFIREIGLQTGYSIELDNEFILQEITDNLLFEVENDIELKKWLIDLAKEKIEEGKNWNSREEIILLGKEMFKESFKLSKNEILKKVSDKKFFKSYISSLYIQNRNISNKLKDIGIQALKIINENNLDISDFTQKSTGVAGFFEKLSIEKFPDQPNSYVLKCINSTEAWYPKNSEKTATILTLVSNNLQDLLNNAIKIYDEDMPVYRTTKLISSILPILGLITDIANRIKEYTSENNSFLISDAAEFLFRITGSNDSPFIYEKTGSYYKYFMIDEFQDTSRLQWHNFKPLILNSLAENHDNLLVGDVKQSIYRWRNSDWKILAEETKKQFQNFNIYEEHLIYNWRSSEKIINFNNFLFKRVSDLLQEAYNNETDYSANRVLYDRIKNIYQEKGQKYPVQSKKNEGLIEVQFFDANNFREESKQKTLSNLELLKVNGFALRDIAILVRNKKDGKEIADYLINYNSNTENKIKFDFISNDSLFIANNTAVRLIIYTLRYILNKNDNLNLYLLVNEYKYYHCRKDNTEHIISDSIKKSDLFDNLPKNFSENAEKIQSLNLYSSIEYITQLFEFEKEPEYHPYLHALKDFVYDFSQNKTANLSSFIEWWDKKGDSKTITVNEEQDAIKIVTIHKSKGLQYKVVIIPFCNWKIETDSVLTNILWCKPNFAPFNEIERIPVKYSSKLKNTIFKEDYNEEKLNSYIDNINLLYVALTRAKEILMINCEKTESKNKFYTVSDLIYQVLNNNIIDDTKESSWNIDQMLFKYGSIVKIAETYQEVKPKEIAYISVPLFERFEFTRNAIDFFDISHNGDSRIEYGKLMHNILQFIKHTNDIDKSINQFLNEGKLDKTEANVIRNKLIYALNKAEVKKWYSNKYKIKTEPELLPGKGNILRPDRIMENNSEVIVLDYKFGENIENKHIKQVLQYIEYIKRINNKTVTGYLWYVDMDLIKKVE